MDVKLADLPLAKPQPATLRKAMEILYGPLRDEARRVNNVSSWVAVGQYSVVEQMDHVCHAGMYQVADDRTIPAKYKKRGGLRKRKGVEQKERTDKRRQFRYLVNYTCHACKPEYWSGQPECHVPFEGQRLRAVMAWYEFLANRSHWARFFVGPKDMFTFLNYGHILDLSAPSFVVHFLCVAWRMPGEYIEQVDNWFELVERGIDPHMALGATMNIGGWNEQIGIVASRGHRLMTACKINAIAHFVYGVVTVTPEEMKPANVYYTTSCNQAYGCRREYGNAKNWMDEAMEQPELVTTVITKRAWGGDVETKTLKLDAFRTVFDPGWQWMMRRVMEHRAAAKW